MVTTAVATVIAVAVTLWLALLRGFRWLYDKIDQTARELRDDNAERIRELHTAIAKNAESIAGIGSRMSVIELVLTAILEAVLSNPTRTADNSPAATTAAQTASERDARTATLTAASGYAS